MNNNSFNPNGRTIYFDMDGTIADLYGVTDWLNKLRSYDVTPYNEAATMNNLDEVCELCSKLQAQFQFKIGIISWCSKETTKSYDKEIRKAKLEWLSQNFGCRIDEIHIIKYGSRKDYIAKDKNGIIFDDDENVRKKWRGIAINPNETEIATFLRNLLSICEQTENFAIFN